jgi:catechol 2,3-dioxygenase-like lactoylglutathione lyase family enzyme
MEPQVIRPEMEAPMFGDKDAVPMIAVNDLSRARKFYQDTLGLQPVGPDNPEVQLYQSGNTRIAVYVSQYAGTNKATTLNWAVDDIESVVADLKSRGIKFEHYDMPGTTRQGDVHVSGPIKNAWFKDPDGNILAVMNRMEVAAKARRM